MKKILTRVRDRRRNGSEKKVEGGCYQQYQQQQHQHQMFHIKVQNECGMCVCVCVCVLVWASVHFQVLLASFQLCMATRLEAFAPSQLPLPLSLSCVISAYFLT